MAPKVLALAGSTRKDSWNKKILTIAMEGALNKGVEVTRIDLADYPMPLYDGDLEDRDGLPERAKALKALFREHQGLLIASPEYNSSITGVLKNTIDWLSREETQDEPALECFRGKTAALISASPGALGGLRGLVHVRAILGNIGVLVIPQQLAVSKVHQAFNDQGEMTDDKQRAGLTNIGTQLAQMVLTLHG